MVEELLESLNPQQREAVYYCDGPLLILAGAGSGKTRVLAHKVAYLIQSGSADPAGIMAVTFTNKAAQELKGRIASIVQSWNFPYTGTFHSLCVRFLRSHGDAIGIKKNFVIYDSEDQMALVRGALNELNRDEGVYSPQAILSAISRAKARLQTLEDLRKKVKDDHLELICEVFARYDRNLANNNALDFDDLLAKTVHLFREDRKVLEYYQNRLTHILVDEYQDVNYAQYVILRELSSVHRRLFVVGDDDQSIYGFRGADVSIILRFEEDFPDARVIKLEQNYRSTRTILSVANCLVRHNKGRKAKTLWTPREKGEKVGTYVAIDGRDEARFVVEEIKKSCLKQARPLSDFVILYRVNAQSRYFEDVLRSEGIPYRIVGGMRFYDRQEIRDLVAYLKLISNPEDSVSLQRIINVPPRGVGGVSLKKLQRMARENGKSVYSVLQDSLGILQAKSKAQVEKFLDLLDVLRLEKERLSVAEILKRVIEGVGYEEYLEREGGAQAAARKENIDELLNSAQGFVDRSDDPSLEGFLREISLVMDIDTWHGDKGEVSLMTMHMAKGLEFPVVFLVGLEEGLLPHSRSKDFPEDLEEERRLCYVAITRAIEKAYVTRAQKRMHKGTVHDADPSRFWRELPEEFLDMRHLGIVSEARPKAKVQKKVTPVAPSPRLVSRFAAGDPVWHRIFGRGKVLVVDRDVVQIEFPGLGVKSLQEEYLQRPGEEGKRLDLKIGDRIRHTCWGTGVVSEMAKDGSHVLAVFPGYGTQMVLASTSDIVKI